MGETKWTKEQQLAIDTRDCNLLVAAAAGSGKTAVLVERIIKIVTNEKKPVDIDRLLVVTFTNAAAGEMRERIADAITKVLDQNPQSKQLQRQLTLLNKSNIMTIHSFCLQVIRNNFHKIELDPNFRIADNTEIILLKSETIEDLFEAKYAEKDEEGNIDKEFLSLVESYGGNRDDKALQEIVLSLYSFVMSGPWPEKWLNEMAEEFNVEEDFDFGRSKWGKILKKSIKIELNGLKNIIFNAKDLSMNSKGLEIYAENLNDDAAIIEDLLASLNGNWISIHEAFSNFSFSRLKSVGKKVEYDKSVQEKIKKLRDDVKEKLNSLKEEIFISSPEEINIYLNELYPRMKCLSDLVIAFDKKYKAKKRERGILDFNDLEHLTLNILTDVDENGEIRPSETALNLRKDFEEILIDEYQDSNNIQEVILGMVSRKDLEMPNLFMVGDVKQSIYRFRQANPGLFLEKYLSYGTEEGDRNRKITLFKNFRSRREVIEGVNYIFRLTMSKNVGELDYTDEEALYLGASFKEAEESNAVTGGPIELHLIEKTSRKPENNSDDEDEVKELTEEENIDNIQLEARMISKRIRDLMSTTSEGKRFRVFDKNIGDYRDVEYRDIVILLRATANYAPVFAEELANQGIPVYSDSDAGYFETIEIKTMMSLLQIIDNPMQDIPLLAVLRSPICAFSPEELIDIRTLEKGAPIFESLMKVPDSEVALSAKNKVKGFIKDLEEWRKKSLHMPIDELIWYLYTFTGYYGYAGAMQGGAQRQANLRILFERARQFEQTSYKGLFNFVNFIKKLQTSSGDMGSAKILGENEDVVRIMSIHKSKGLEFPVVIMAGAGKNFNLRDMNRSILFHHELGYGPNYVDPERRISYQTILKQALKRRIKLESLSEEMRVLYVAFTRAKEKLIITGAVNDLETAAVKWCSNYNEENKIPEYALIKGKNYLDWIGPCIAKHKDGEKIRELAKVNDDNGVVWDDSNWHVHLWKKQDIIVNENYDLVDKLEQFNEELENSLEEADIITEERLSDLKKEIPESKYKDEIYGRLSWKYPFEKAAEIPAKLSVTELKRLGNSKFSDEYTSNMYAPSLIKKPLFLEEVKELTAAEKGTIIHSVMQHVDLNKTTLKDIKEKVDEMVARELITDKQAEAVDINKIERFFTSDIGKRVVEANKRGKLFREFPFYMRLNSTEAFENLEKGKYEDEIILLQGVIDCFFEDEDGVVLIDYKTDFYKNISDIMTRYEKQIYYYSKALKKITGKTVKEKYLYLFSTGKIVEYK